MQDHPHQKYIDAASAGQLEYFLKEARSRVSDFCEELYQYQGNEFKIDKNSLANGEIPDELTIGTRLGPMKLRVAYALDGNRVRAWMVFFDEDTYSVPLQTRRLLAIKLGPEDWIGPFREGYLNKFGKFAVEEVLREAVAAKLRLDSDFVAGIR